MKNIKDCGHECCGGHDHEADHECECGDDAMMERKTSL